MATVLADNSVSFTYTFLPINDMQVETTDHPQTGKKVVSKVLVQGESLNPTERFWTSLFSRYGFNSAFFKFFDHAEVFQRISEVEKNDRMRLCIERDDKGNGQLLGVSNPTKPIVVFDELMDLLGRYRGSDITYHNGIVESTHTPRAGANQFKIGGDEFANRFLMATPIDGYGGPNIYLSLLRLICNNAVIGYTKQFRAGLALGKGDDDVGPTLTRALDGFNNEEGYVSLRQRMESSISSWASVFESLSLYRLLVKLHAQKTINDSGVVPAGANYIADMLNAPADGKVDGLIEGVGSPLLVAFHKMTGDTSKLYGLANLDALSIKRQRTLPVKCTVYDLLNFATEVATHFANPSGARQINSWLGNLIVDEYDMEGCKDKFGDFADFHVERKVEAGLTGSENS